jgi:O-antigen/teichoic acid export membrane protein
MAAPTTQRTPGITLPAVHTTPVPATPRGSGRLSLRANFSWTLASQLVYAVFGWGMLMVIAKLGSAEQVGYYALGLAVVGPVMAFSMLDLRAVQATDALHRYPFGLYLALRLVTIAVALAIIGGIASSPVYHAVETRVILAAAAASAVEALSDIIYGRFQQEERLDRIAISIMLKAPLAMFGMMAAMLATGSVVFGCLFVAATRMAVLMAYDIPCLLRMSNADAESKLPGRRYRSVLPTWNARGLRTLALLTLPLGFSAFFISLKMNAPRYVLSAYVGDSALGVYAAMMYVMQVGSLFLGSMNQAASPVLARHYAAGRWRPFCLLLGKLVGLATAVGVMAVVTIACFGREILLTLYTSEFAAHANIFFWAALACAIGYAGESLGVGMTASRRFAIQMPLQVLVLAATIVGCVVLVPARGLLGAVNAITAAAVINLLGGLLVCLHAVVRMPTEPSNASPADPPESRGSRWPGVEITP